LIIARYIRTADEEFHVDAELLNISLSCDVISSLTWNFRIPPLCCPPIPVYGNFPNFLKYDQHA
ncbi:hypothetical protein T10_3328, partial [Trichinella papuae]